MSFDSRPETWKHIARVRELLQTVRIQLMQRAVDHDQSKLVSPEREGFDEWTPRLRETPYGTAEYAAALRQMEPFLRAHYKANSHHPEHYERGIYGMDLLDLIEMLADWKAAGERHESGGDLRASVELNQQRFGYSDEMRELLLRTAERLGWV